MRHNLPAVALNVAHAYHSLAEDLRSGDHSIADFATGVRVHQLLDTIGRSADPGTRRPRIKKLTGIAPGMVGPPTPLPSAAQPAVSLAPTTPGGTIGGRVPRSRFVVRTG
jgi:hypothetical protein